MFGLLQGADAVLVAALLVAVAALVFSLLRSNKPDPKMAFLLTLLHELPAEEDTGQEAEGKENPEPQGKTNASGSHIFDFFA
jgi:hypothetical protein